MRVTVSLPETLVKKIDERSPMEGRDSRSNTIASELKNLYQLERYAVDELSGVFDKGELELMKKVVDSWEYSPVYHPARLLGVEVKGSSGLAAKHNINVKELIEKIKGIGSFQAHQLIALLRKGALEELE